MSPWLLIFGVLWIGFVLFCVDIMGFLGLVLGVGFPAFALRWLYHRTGGDSFPE